MPDAQIILQVNEERRDLRAKVTAAIQDLDAILASDFGLPGAEQSMAPLNELAAAVKKLAEHQRAMILRLVQL